MKQIIAAAFFLIVSGAAAQSQVKTLSSIKDETSMTYYLVHPLHKIEATSRDVTSTVSVDVSSNAIKSVKASVDVTTFNSGNSNRDSHAMEVIDAIDFPEASFTSTSVSSHNDSLFVSGKLTFHGVTRDIMMNSLVQWSDKKMIVHAEFWISLTNFQIERPALLLVPVEDGLRFTITTAYAL
jgi:polyisoprenoid-binding protein YceI